MAPVGGKGKCRAPRGDWQLTGGMSFVVRAVAALNPVLGLARALTAFRTRQGINSPNHATNFQQKRRNLAFSLAAVAIAGEPQCFSRDAALSRRLERAWNFGWAT